MCYSKSYREQKFWRVIELLPFFKWLVGAQGDEVPYRVIRRLMASVVWNWSNERSRSNVRELKWWSRLKRRNDSRDESGLDISYYTQFHKNHIWAKRTWDVDKELLTMSSVPVNLCSSTCVTMKQVVGHWGEKEKRDWERAELMGRSNHRPPVHLVIFFSISELNTSVYPPKLLVPPLHCLSGNQSALHWLMLCPWQCLLVTCLFFSWTYYIFTFWKCSLV